MSDIDLSPITFSFCGIELGNLDNLLMHKVSMDLMIRRSLYIDFYKTGIQDVKDVK